MIVRYGQQDEREEAHHLGHHHLKKIQGNVVLVGEHPMATETVEGVKVPKNAAACLFLPQEGFLDRSYFLTSHPDHAAGVTKMAFLLAYEKGVGVDMPALGISKEGRLTVEQLDRLVRIQLSEGRGLTPEEEDARRRLIPALVKATDPLVLKVLDKYVPIVMRGCEEQIEICVRKDENVDDQRMNQAIGIIEGDFEVPPTKVKVVATQRGMEPLLAEFERQGRLWRMLPEARSKEKQQEFIRHSRVNAEGVRLYYAAGTGERLLAASSVEKMVERHLNGVTTREQLAGQLNYLVTLSHSRNRVRQPSLSMFEVDERKCSVERFEEAYEFIAKKDDSGKYANPEAEAKAMVKKLAEDYREATSPDFRKDNKEDNKWRVAMYSRLMGVRTTLTEEARIGLSREFVGDVTWLPGGRVVSDERGSRVEFEKYASQHVKDIITDFHHFCQDRQIPLEHINVGLTVDSMSKRRKMSVDEYREVYVVEWRVRGDERNRVDVIRRQKWDLRHYLEGMEFGMEGSDKKTFLGKHTIELMKKDEQGRWYREKDDGNRDYLTNKPGVYVVGEGRKLSFEDAETLHDEYTMFIAHRHILKQALGIPTLRLDKIKSNEKVEGHGEVEVVFFGRSYVEGIAVDKIEESRFGNLEFCTRLAFLMGKEAATNFALGRANPFTGSVYYADGDEIICFDRKPQDPHAMPNGVITADITGILGDVESPHGKFTSEYAKWLGGVLRKALDRGVERKALTSIALQFSRGLVEEYERIRRPDVIGNVNEDLALIFEDMKLPRGQSRYGWMRCDYLVPKARDRILATTSRQIVESLMADENLKEFLDILPKTDWVFPKP